MPEGLEDWKQHKNENCPVWGWQKSLMLKIGKIVLKQSWTRTIVFETIETISGPGQFFETIETISGPGQFLEAYVTRVWQKSLLKPLRLTLRNTKNFEMLKC